MNGTLWMLVLTVGLLAGTAGALIPLHGPALLRALTPHAARLREAAKRRERPRASQPAPARRACQNEEALVLIPDGRPWPLGPALQLLELAWRWQVAHGTNLPLRARQGEGAYVWRPPLSVRASSDQPRAEAEH